MKLNTTVRLGQLLDIYGELLTKKKADVLSMYVNENMSYQEIAESLGITKPAVLDFIKSAQTKLENLEQKLKILSLRQKLNGLVQNSTNLKQDLISLLKEM